MLCKTDLLEMLTFRRPANGKTEQEFIKMYIDSVPGMSVDEYGNRWFLHDGSRTLISVHTDTVHRMDGKQRLQERAGIVSLSAREKVSNCLGADDTAGIYAALRMIEYGVPVSFVFHRSEEIGGLGSSWVADNYDDWLAETFDRCVALDRRGTQDVITSQYGVRCCSDKFALALARQLKMGHKPASGVFTDSANYMHLIPECSNVSIGYAKEHTALETLDVDYLERLIERLCAVKWDKLPTEHLPEVETGGDDYWGEWNFSLERDLPF